MRVLVTGGAGFIGSHVAERMLGAGHAVVDVVDNLTTGLPENVPVAAGFRCLNIDKDLRALHPYDLIVHCAASYSDRDKWHRDTDTNVTGAINVAIAAREWGARVVYFQTALIYGNNPYAGFNPFGEITWANPSTGSASSVIQPYPIEVEAPTNPESSYAISKLAAEQYLRLSGVPLLTLRLANIYGPRNLSGPIPAFYKRLTERQPCTVVNTRRDFVYIDDLVNLVAQAVAAEATGTYHVSTGRDYPIAQVYDAVQGALDVYDAPEPEHAEAGADDAPTILLDPTETARDFGWQATTDLDEGVAQAVAWYGEHGVEQTYTHLAVKT